MMKGATRYKAGGERLIVAVVVWIIGGCVDQGGEITARRLWVRPTVGDARQGSGVPANAAIYGSIHNASGREDRIVGVSVPPSVARAAEIHETRREGNSLSMEEVEALSLPAEGELTFEPGGRHVMLMGLSGPLREGDRFDVTFRFAQAGELIFSVRVGDDAP